MAWFQRCGGTRLRRDARDPATAMPNMTEPSSKAIRDDHMPAPATMAARRSRRTDDPAGGRLYLWRRAHRRAWKTPPREIALRRLARAEELGMTYREYTLEILERGKYL